MSAGAAVVRGGASVVALGSRDEFLDGAIAAAPAAGPEQGTAIRAGRPPVCRDRLPVSRPEPPPAPPDHRPSSRERAPYERFIPLRIARFRLAPSERRPGRGDRRSGRPDRRSARRERWSRARDHGSREADFRSVRREPRPAPGERAPARSDQLPDTVIGRLTRRTSDREARTSDPRAVTSGRCGWTSGWTDMSTGGDRGKFQVWGGLVGGRRPARPPTGGARRRGNARWLSTPVPSRRWMGGEASISPQAARVSTIPQQACRRAVSQANIVPITLGDHLLVLRRIRQAGFLGQWDEALPGRNGTKHYPVGALATRHPECLSGPRSTLHYRLLGQGVELECFHAAASGKRKRSRRRSRPTSGSAWASGRSTSCTIALRDTRVSGQPTTAPGPSIDNGRRATSGPVSPSSASCIQRFLRSEFEIFRGGNCYPLCTRWVGWRADEPEKTDPPAILAEEPHGLLSLAGYRCLRVGHQPGLCRLRYLRRLTRSTVNGASSQTCRML